MTLRIYTDGSWHPQTRHAGCGIVIEDEGRILCAAVYLGCLPHGLDNHATELTAAAYALEWVRPGVSVELIVDCEAVRWCLADRRSRYVQSPAYNPYLRRLRLARRHLGELSVMRITSHSPLAPRLHNLADWLANVARRRGLTEVWDSSEEQAA